jgi:hypothetical protein
MILPILLILVLPHHQFNLTIINEHFCFLSHLILTLPPPQTIQILILLFNHDVVVTITHYFLPVPFPFIIFPVPLILLRLMSWVGSQSPCFYWLFSSH